MGNNLRSIFFSLAALVAVAARADGATTSPGQDDAASHQGDAAAWAAGRGGADQDAASDGGYAQRTAKMDDQASGSASGEPKKQRRTDALDDWNRNQFLRETWDSP